MGEPARELDPAPRPVPDLLADVAQAYQRACEVVRPREGKGGIAVIYLARRMAELDAALRDYASALREHDKALILGGSRTSGTFPEPVPVTPLRPRSRRGTHRHASPWPRAIQGGIPLVAVTAARTGVAHGIRVKVLAASSVAAGLGVLTLGASNSVNLPDVAHAGTRAPSAASAPRLAPADAVPYLSPVSYQPRHSAGTESTSARHVPGRHARVPVVAVTPPTEPPSLPSPPSSPVAAAGTLVTSQVAVVLGGDGKGSLTFSAQGGAVTWSATSSSPAVVVAAEDGSSSGTLSAGDSVILVITVQPGAVPGPVTITVSTADGNVITVPVMVRAGI